MAGAARLVDLCCTGVLFQGSTRMNLFVSRQKSQEGSSLRSVLVLCCPVFCAVKVGLNTVWNKVCKYLMVLCSAFVGAIRFTRRVSSLGISLWDWRSVFSVGILRVWLSLLSIWDWASLEPCWLLSLVHTLSGSRTFRPGSTSPWTVCLWSFALGQFTA